MLSKNIQKYAQFDANCIEIGFLLLKILQSYIFKMVANGGRHIEKNIKAENCKSHLNSQKDAYIYMAANISLSTTLCCEKKYAKETSGWL